MTALTDSGLQRLFASTLDSMRKTLAAERYLILYEGALQAAHGLDPQDFWSRAPVSLTLLEKLTRTTTPWLAEDLQADPEAETASLLLAGIRSAASAPLLDERGCVRGLLYADHCGRAGAFSRSDLARLTTLARELETVLWGKAPPVSTPRPLPPPPLRRGRPLPPAPAPAPSATGNQRLDGRTMTIFLRSLSVMVAAGIPLPRGLHILEGQTGVASAARLSIERGHSLSTALASASSSFTPFQLKLVKVGESTGSLVEVLRQLADYEERRQALSLRLRSALTYPACLLGLCLVMLMLGPPYLLKGQLRMLEMAGGELPLLTRALYAASDPRLLLGLALAGGLALAAGWRFVRTPSGALWLDRTLLSMPRLNRLWRLVAVARFSRSLALQLHVGLSVLEAVPQAAAASGSPVLAGRAAQSVARLREGGDLTEALETADFFPRAFLSTLRAGEDSGRVSASLQWIARLYEQDLEASLEMFVAALEPTIMLLMGLATGLVALATMLPMVRVVQSL